MKKLLTIMWLVIISGSAFIAIHYAKSNPENAENDNPEIIVEQAPALTSEQSLPSTYKENIALGDQHLLENNPLQAIINYKKASSIKKNSSEALSKLAQAYLANNDPQAALTVIEALKKLSNNSLEIGLLEAKAQLKSKEFELAKNIVWNLDQNNLEVKYYRAIILILYKEFEQAKEVLKEINQIETPDKAELKIKQKAQIYQNAFDTFSYYKETEPVFQNLLLAKALTDTEEYESAIPLLFEIINEKNNYRDAWVVLGYAYLKSGKSADANDALKQAYDLDDQKPETLFFLGLAYFANDNVEDAIFYLEKAREKGFEPKEQIDLKLGDLYILEKNYERASSKYEDIVSKSNSNIDLFARIVWLNIEKIDNSEKALKYALKSKELYPNIAMSHNLSGWAYTANGNYSQAKAELEKALELNPKFDAAHLNIAWLYQKEGFSNLAKEYYKKAYILGQGTSVGNLAALRFNNLTKEEAQTYYQVNITSP